VISLLFIKAAFGKRSGQPEFDARADTNNDGIVDVKDHRLFRERYFRHALLTRGPVMFVSGTSSITGDSGTTSIGPSNQRVNRECISQRPQDTGLQCGDTTARSPARPLM